MHACVLACGLAAMFLPVCACASGTGVRCWRALHPVGWLRPAVQHGCMTGVRCQGSELVLLVQAAFSASCRQDNQHVSWAAGIVLANLRALTTLTDLAGNLPLLQENIDTNGEQIMLLLHSTHDQNGCSVILL